jgi:hypothetical protein
MADEVAERERVTPRTEKECREVVRSYKEAVAQRIHCPFCEKDVAINKFGVHCVGKHQMNDEKLMKALDGKHPAILSKLLEFRKLSRIANAAKAALYRRDNLGKPIGSRRGSRLPVKVEQINVQSRLTDEALVAETRNGFSQEEMSEQARAATTLQKAAAMVTFATLMERHGPESISALLNGMAAVDKLPRRRV